MEELQVPKKLQPQDERILDSRVKKSTRNKVYKENLIKWKDTPKTKATWIVESDFKKYGISLEFLSPQVT